jgi:hypothetical protein
MKSKAPFAFRVAACASAAAIILLSALDPNLDPIARILAATGYDRTKQPPAVLDKIPHRNILDGIGAYAAKRGITPA